LEILLARKPTINPDEGKKNNTREMGFLFEHQLRHNDETGTGKRY
jgi:hypothetical protein